ncbi:LysR family transcriptional regulator [Rhodovulum adriaticum]|uniref:DNA-binding transcriptional LysR family regulator n=1 Tax=Rhodovulum adriaticum TaxID=35804 RepID=A0A4R2NIY4_RHOAD|nr:LysR family transcriptional regulator [Rhodovulum adriaticum]MBK1634634.1 LysR family transcriptional regulator [Rhodovulum adriaticum]TCP21262.1 DNA-binding transcriptional LysR family regulator [Rhodovulum adriaticum]
MGQPPGRFTLWGIEVFVAVVDEGTLSAAARRLGASVSALSQQLAALEAALGAALIDRGTRPLATTAAGEVFLRRARTILAEAEQARAEVAAHDLAALPLLRLGMIEDFETDVTPRLLSGMAEELTRSQFQLETGPSHRLLGLLDARALDVVVTAQSATPDKWMEVHPLLSEPFVIAAPRGAVGPQGCVLDHLMRFPFLHYTQRHQMGRQIAAHMAAQDMNPAGRFELDSYNAILAMVAGGAGWTILTPLAWLHGQRFAAAVDLHPLPGAPLSRQIALTARAGVLDDMPARIAARMRALLAETVVAPAVQRVPWLAGALTVL